MTKRLFDFTLALALLPFAAVISAAAAIAIRAETPGSPLLTQVRVGKNQRHISVLKLRTMHSDTGDRPSHEVGTSSITRVGAILRSTKIDELPQVWNVIKGDMSFVGPRPCLPMQEELISERQRHGVYSLLPGITGPGQVAGIDMSTPVQLAAVDASYALNSSIRTDLALILQTAVGKGSGDAATVGTPTTTPDA